MNAKDIYKKIDDLNEAVSMNISMSGDNAEDVGNLFNMMRGDKPEMKPVDIKMLSPRDDIAKSLSHGTKAQRWTNPHHEVVRGSQAYG